MDLLLTDLPEPTDDCPACGEALCAGLACLTAEAADELAGFRAWVEEREAQLATVPAPDLDAIPF